jgi:hypothetical protein
MQGQVNLRDAVHGEISYTSPRESATRFRKPVVLMARAWHPTESTSW